eukprot:COSAG01_NODE_25_length_37050_cov_211.559119_20_plen_59_part_00
MTRMYYGMGGSRTSSTVVGTYQQGCKRVQHAYRAKALILAAGQCVSNDSSYSQVSLCG